MSNVLEVHNLDVWFTKGKKETHIVKNVSFSLAKAETLGILGESGCGKSVTALSIMRLLSGKAKMGNSQIWLHNRNLLSLSPRELRRIRGKEISMIFQEPMSSLNPVLSVGKQVSEVLEEHERLSKRQAKPRVIELFKHVGIARPDEIFHEYPHNLSGGMKQRIMIAIAIACKPTLLIADEPTTALDVTIQAQILQLLKTIREQNGMSVIIITHDLGVVAEVCDRVVIMYAGQVVEEADTRTLLRNPLHPYTVGLIKSMPKISSEQERLYSIPGSIPMPEELTKGCRFASRCDQVMLVCHEENPELIQVDQHTACRCWRYTMTGSKAVSK